MPPILEYRMVPMMICSVKIGEELSAAALTRGLGKTVVPTVIVIMGSCVFRVIWVYTIFAHFHTIPALYLLYPCSWILTALAEIAYFASCYKRAMAIFRKPAAA